MLEEPAKWSWHACGRDARVHAGRRGRLSMAAWVEPLLYAAAEAAAMREWDLAARALDAFSACVSHGAGLEARVHGLVCSAGS